MASWLIPHVTLHGLTYTTMSHNARSGGRRDGARVFCSRPAAITSAVCLDLAVIIRAEFRSRPAVISSAVHLDLAVLIRAHSHACAAWGNNHVFTSVGCLASWWFSYPGLPLHHWLVLQAQILGKSAGLRQGSRRSVVRASTAKVGGLGFDSQWLPMHFSVQFVSTTSCLPTSSYHRLSAL